MSTWDILGNFQAVNAVEVTSLRIERGPALKRVHDADVVMWHAIVEIEGTFKQSFELQSFPLDTQSLIVRVEGNNIKQVVFQAVQHQDAILSVEKDLCPLTGWEWLGASVAFTASDPALSKQRNEYTQVVIDFKLARLWKPYFIRIVLFIFFVTFSSALCWVMDPTVEFEGR